MCKPLCKDMALDLNSTLSLTGPFDADTASMLADLQGNLLRGHGRPAAAHVFVSFPSAAAGNAFVAATVGLVISAKVQLEQAAAFRANGTDGGLFTILLLSASGYAVLGVPAAQRPNDGPFVVGMAARTQVLNDPPRASWEPTFQPEIHAMVLLAHTDQTSLNAAVADLGARAGAAGVVILGVEFGQSLKNAQGRNIEHFGYIDGRSQPLVVTEDVAAEAGTTLFSAELSLFHFFVRDPGSTNPNSFGSYFVFRKLEQNVAGFKTREKQLAADLGLTGNDEQRAGAMVVGRFEDGTPLALSPLPVGGAPSNDFLFDQPGAPVVPHQAHIRKTNPRGDTEFSESVQMLRRGIPFGTRTDNPNDRTIDPTARPTGGVGLLFMSYQSHLAFQFEFMQQSWANNKDFSEQGTGIDPIIGQGTAPAQAWPNPIDPVQPAASLSFAHFVTMKGGEYFFAPSLTTLRGLGGVPSQDDSGVAEAAAGTLTKADKLPTVDLQRGDESEEVAVVQRFLAALRSIRLKRGFDAASIPDNPGPPDGKYGPQTARSVRTWQVIIGVTVDGLWGPETAAASAGSVQIAPPLPAVALEESDVGDDDIGILQMFLTSRAALGRRLFPGGPESRVDPGGIDQDFGPRTRAAVTAWQVFLGQPANGKWSAHLAAVSEPFTFIG
jgi:Dyp-type peroxidase family